MSDHLLDDTLLAALAKARPAGAAMSQPAEASQGARLFARIVAATGSDRIGPTARFVDRRNPISLSTGSRGAGPATRGRNRSRPRWVAAGVAASLVAAGATVGMTRGSTPSVRQPATVLTAAEVEQVSRASTASFGTSGEAHGVVSAGGPTHSIDATFSGPNYNETTVWGGGMTVTDRFVNGTLYLTQTGQSGWTRFIGTPPSWWYETAVPDPRTLLLTLAPAAQFQVVGTEARGGSELTHVRALDPGRVPLLAFFGEGIGGEVPGSRVTALDLWVDGSNVVERIDISEGAGPPPYSAAATDTISVTFSKVGTAETVAAPSAASAEPGPWLSVPPGGR